MHYLPRFALLTGLCLGLITSHADAAEDFPEYTAPELLGILSTIPEVAANPAGLYTGPWTNWYNDPTEVGLVKLAVMRGVLDRFNLYHSYLPNVPTGNQEAGPMPANALTTRTLDGSWNRLDDPLVGAAYTRFGRNVSLAAIQPETDTLLTPDPRLVSQTLLKRRGRADAVPFLNLWAAAWIQFQIHGWFEHETPDRTQPLSIPLKRKDPIRRKTGQTAIVVGSTPRDATTAEEEGLPPSFLNTVSHWWDGSQVYGSDEETAARLRRFEGGQLKLTEDGKLPLNEQGFGDSGLSSNWWLGLELMHTLFVKEHNSIAAMLAAAHPEMEDQELYDKARMINAALMAKIHTLDWTPAILPNRELTMGMNANWAGLQQYVSQDPVNQGILRGAVPPPDPVIYGILGGRRDDKGVAFSMTEEFAAVYRMHPLMPEAIRIHAKPRRRVRIEQTLGEGARILMERYSFEELALTFGCEHPGQLTLRNYPRFLTEHELPNGEVIDMGAVDILRDRERGVPRYNQFRRHLFLRPLSSTDELTDDPRLQRALRRVYDSIEDVDLLVGCLAESTRPTGFGFGETAFQTFILMASRRLEADRFYTEDYRPEVYTQEGLDWVAENNFKSVLLRHLPALQDVLGGLDNPFAPWDAS